MVYVRLKDSEGDWSLVQNRPIYKFAGSASSVFIDEVEIYFDSDPGFGNGTIVNVTNGINIDEDINQDISTLSDGFHMMYIRVKDDDGFWSLVQNRPIYKFGSSTSAVVIEELEIFFDSHL